MRQTEPDIKIQETSRIQGEGERERERERENAHRRIRT